MVLERELAYFLRNKADLLSHYRGQYVVVKDDQFLGAYTTFQDGIEAGVRAFGNQPFLVKEVTEADTEIQLPALSVGMLYAHY